MYHPERETEYQYLEHQVSLCDECRTRRDPELYCKFCEGCVIWFLGKKPFD